MNNRKSFLTVLEAEKSKMKVLADLVSGDEDQILLTDDCSQMTVLTYPKGRESSLDGVPFRTLLPFVRALLS